jgi:hypothetical protein
MTISANLMMALLSMDAYNRGYGAGINDAGSNDQDGLGEAGFVGNAHILSRPSEIDYSAWQAAGFYGVAYDWNGQTVISYRGTDEFSCLNGSNDIYSGWPLGAGHSGASQAGLAIAFFNAITQRSETYSGWNPAFDNVDDTILVTGPSLGGGLAARPALGN